jgi:hypothetical protein
MTNVRIKIEKGLMFVIFLSTLVLISVECVSGTAPEEEWNNTFGGTYNDKAKAVWQTTDEGYIIAGETESYGAGEYDFWLVKTDLNGNEQWNKTFGGTDNDRAKVVQQTTDEGYIIAGETKSYGSDRECFWLVKTDSNGNEQWNKTIKGEDTAEIYSVWQTTDDGYIITGATWSYYGDRTPWFVKTDSNGNKQWSKIIRITEFDSLDYVHQTIDSGYILAGCSYADYSCDNPWLVKTDSNGNEQWNKTYGEINSGCAESVQQITDNGYIIVGALPYGQTWLIKTDSNGNRQWNKTIGENFWYGNKILLSDDGGYIISGYNTSRGDFCTGSWFMKTDSNGNEQWNKTFVEPDYNLAYSVRQTTDGGYILAGFTESYNVHGEADFWLIKVCAENDDWKNEWIGMDSEEGAIITTSELQDAIHHWLDNIPVRGHIMSTADLQEIIVIWLSD